MSSSWFPSAKIYNCYDQVIYIFIKTISETIKVTKKKKKGKKWNPIRHSQAPSETNFDFCMIQKSDDR